MIPSHLAALNHRLEQSDAWVEQLGPRPTYHRQIYTDLEQHLRRFLAGETNRWLIMSGLRGVGKTTLLTQLYHHPDLADGPIKRLYLSLDDLLLMGHSVNDLVEVIRHWRHRAYPKNRLVIFLDEVHYDPRWALGCKVIFDQVPGLFLICTGSSAISLRLGPDNARRANLIRVNPLHFTEFIALNQLERGQTKPDQPEEGLAGELRAAIFGSKSARQAYDRAKTCWAAIASYYTGLGQIGLTRDSSGLQPLVNDYINGLGSLPSPENAGNAPLDQQQLGLITAPRPAPAGRPSLQLRRSRILALIKQTLVEDIGKITTPAGQPGRLGLGSALISRLPQLAGVLANSDRVSLAKLSRDLGGVRANTLKQMLELLEIGNLVVEVPAMGQILARNNNLTPKYLFATPALRQALVPLEPETPASTRLDRHLRGRLLEDTTIMYLDRLFSQPNQRKLVEYDSRKDGADFIVYPDGAAKNSVVIEVGYNKTTGRQIKQTIQRRGEAYGLIITTGTGLKLDETIPALYLPLEDFLLT